MRSIVCFGEALIDFLAEPAPHDGPRTFLQYAGGAPANVAVAIARLGGAAEFVGMLSEDSFGDFLSASLQTTGVGVAYTRRTTLAPTALAFVTLDANGERSFGFYRPPAADLLFREDDFDPAMFAATGIFHACSNSLTEAAIAQTTLAGMRRARGAGALVSFDVNLRPALWTHKADALPRIRAAAAAADIVKFSSEEFSFLADRGDEETVLHTLWDGAPRFVIVTDGAASLRWYTRHARGTLATFDVRVVDTTAAGDAFVGGLLFQLNEHGVTASGLAGFLADRDVLAATLRFAAACGALAVMRAGAFAAMPAHAEVTALLAQPSAQTSFERDSSE